MPLLQWCWPIALAPFVGSFLTVLIVRLPSGRSVVWGRSTCDHCRHPLGVGDLVPIASWLVTGGRCRHCGAPVTSLYSLVEATSLVAAVWAAATVTAGASLWLSCALAWCLLALAIIDARQRLATASWFDRLTMRAVLAAAGYNFGLLLLWLAALLRALIRILAETTRPPQIA